VRGGRKVPKRSGGIALPDLDADYDQLGRHCEILAIGLMAEGLVRGA